MKYIKYIGSVLLALGAVVSILCWVLGDGDTNYVDLALKVAYIFLGVAILVSVAFPLINVATNPKGALGTLVGVAILAVIIGVSFALSSTEPIMLSNKEEFTNVAELRITDISLYSTYFLGIGAILSIVFCEIRNAFK